MGTVGQCCEPTSFVGGDAVVHALARDAETRRHLGDLPSILDHRQHSLIALFHDTELHQHVAHLPSARCPQEKRHRRRCKDQPDQVSTIR